MTPSSRWYVVFPGTNIIVLMPPNVTEAKASQVAIKQAGILGAESATLKSTKRLYADVAARLSDDSSPDAG
jgi:hypothetical protein